MPAGMPVPEAAPWPPFGHVCLAVVRWVAVELVACEVAACELAECDFVLAGCPVVAAAATPRPRASMAPSAPAPTAVPISGRVILTWSVLLCLARAVYPGAGRLARCDQ
jgi:hypothetical protein